MLARALLALLAVEVAVYVWIAAQVAPVHGRGTAVAVVLAIAIAVRAVSILLTYAIASAGQDRRAPRAPMGIAAAIVEIGKEIAAFSALFTVLQPFVRLTMGRPDRSFGPVDGTPVLLVHGYVCNRGVWWHLARRLAASGYRVHTVDLEPPLGDIDSCGEQVAARLDAIRRASGGREVLLVGHSMGGLAIRACLRSRGAEGVLGVVTLGTPHAGTALAPWGFGTRSMRLACEWLGALSAGEGGVLPTSFVAIYSTHDEFVSPFASGRLEGATNIAIAGIGHLAMVFSSRVEETLLDSLRGMAQARVRQRGAPLPVPASRG